MAKHITNIRKPVVGGPTNHHSPWALVRRAGNTVGKRPSTRVAYLVDTVVGADGKAVALRGFVGTNKLTGWSKSLRRIEWSDIVRRWSRQPDPALIEHIKQRMPRIREKAAGERSD